MRKAIGVIMRLGLAGMLTAMLTALSVSVGLLQNEGLVYLLLLVSSLTGLVAFPFAILDIIFLRREMRREQVRPEDKRAYELEHLLRQFGLIGRHDRVIITRNAHRPDK